MRASSSTLAKACNVKKQEMDMFLCGRFKAKCESYYNRELGECIHYKTYDTLKVVKAFSKGDCNG